MPTKDFDLGLFKAKVETFNPNVRVKGSPRWLNQPSPEKRTSSVVFSVATEAEKQTCIRKGLIVAGITVKVEAAKAFTTTTQYFRYQGYNHNPQTCKNRPKYRLYAGNHFTRHHKCSTCSASGTCSHVQLLCSNCSGPHPANDIGCEVYQAIKARRPTKGPTTGPTIGSTTGSITGPTIGLTIGSTTGPIVGSFEEDTEMEAGPQTTGPKDLQLHDGW